MDDRLELRSELAGTVTSVVAVGAVVRAGAPVVTIESMKMEHPSAAPTACEVVELRVSPGDAVRRDDLLAVVRATSAAPEPQDDESLRTDLDELHRRRALLGDEHRPEAVARVRARGRRTTRELLSVLLDPGSLSELGGLAVAAQRDVHDEEALAVRTPADGVITGIARVDGQPTAVLAYDPTVLAGTQGWVGHAKTDRLLDLVARQSLPVLLVADGGGGRPSDTDVPVVSGLQAEAFRLFARLAGSVPRVGLVTGPCFAGNAGLLGMCDVAVAAEGASIGMGGPAMVEAAGLGAYAPEDLGPVRVHAAAGSVDVVAPDPDTAAREARRVLGLLRGLHRTGAAADQTALRDAVPTVRTRAYDVRRVVDVLLDDGSALELRPAFGSSVVTALGRLDGRPVGVLASDCARDAGALTADACDKAARFLQLCDAFGLPVLSLIDTPGIAVGPDAEATALVRHSARVFTAGARMTVPLVAVVLRKAYGLGAQALMGGSTRAPLLTLCWPTGELAPMGLEGAVRLGLRAQLAELPGEEAERVVAETTAALVHRARAVSVASYGEVDDVVDPAETRDRVIAALAAAPAGRRGTWADTW